MRWSYEGEARRGDHVWWISDVRRFARHYPQWSLNYDAEQIIREVALEYPRREHVAVGSRQ